MIRKREASALLKKYRRGRCTEEEKQLLENWYAQWNREESILPEEELVLAEDEIWQGLQRKRSGRGKKTFFPWMAAASILICLSFLGYWYYTHKQVDTRESQLLVHDVLPGANHAIITLTDGRQININHLKSGEIIDQEGFRIIKDKNGQLVYTALPQEERQANETAIPYNQIRTPRGGQFQLQLPDGTKVWLNASSSIRYPLHFSTHERRVELVGEAYFEVEKQSAQAQPFIVQTSDQEVQVLGTHFNVNAYENEPSTRTTLLEGKVKVLAKESRSIVLLKPNEQSSLQEHDHKLQVNQVDPREFIAWKEGDFLFNNTDLKTIMRQLERWYNVEVIDLDQFPNNTYNGKMTRSVKLSKVLQILELTSNLKFKIEEGATENSGKRIRLLP